MANILCYMSLPLLLAWFAARVARKGMWYGLHRR